MRFLKLILISFIILFIVICFLFALFPRDITVSKVVRIPVSQEKVASTLSDLSSWSSWNQFLTEEGQGKINLSTNAKGPGASLQSGQLTVRIISASQDSISSVWSNSKGKEFGSAFLLMPAPEGGVYVQWKFNFHLAWYPWEKMASMFYERQFAPVMEKSLLNLQQYVEQNP
jgi:hypothetical protein